MRSAYALAFILFFYALLSNSNAYFNVTYLNTTVQLYNTSGHVTETFEVFVSNSSESQYVLDRQAINLSLNDWQKALNTAQLEQHIVNPVRGVTNFKFLPGPLTAINRVGSTAIITMEYDSSNVTSVKNIGPRQFAYTFNDTVFNFAHTASGEALPTNTRFNILVPAGAEVVSVYPVPDFPKPTLTPSYVNVTEFAWYAGDPLSSFSFSYIMHQSLQDEVLVYFTNFYDSYILLIYMVIFAIIILAIIYVYRRFFA